MSPCGTARYGFNRESLSRPRRGPVIARNGSSRVPGGLEHQRAVAHIVEHFLIGDGPGDQFVQERLKLALGQLTGVVLEEASDAALLQFERQTVEVADVRHD